MSLKTDILSLLYAVENKNVPHSNKIVASNGAHAPQCGVACPAVGVIDERMLIILFLTIERCVTIVIAPVCNITCQSSAALDVYVHLPLD